MRELFFTQQVTMYYNAWRELWKKQTFLHIALDFSMIIIALIILLLNAVVFSSLSAPLIPVLNEITELESSTSPENPVTNDDRIATLMKHNVDPKKIIRDGTIVAFIFYLLFVVIYSLEKYFVWNQLRKRKWKWREWKNISLVSTIWLLLLIFIPIGVFYLHSITAVWVLFIFLLCTAGLLPLVYAISWKKIKKLPFGRYLFLLFLAFITWYVPVNIIGLTVLVNVFLYLVLWIAWNLLYFAWLRKYITVFLEVQNA